MNANTYTDPILIAQDEREAKLAADSARRRVEELTLPPRLAREQEFERWKEPKE